MKDAKPATINFSPAQVKSELKDGQKTAGLALTSGKSARTQKTEGLFALWPSATNQANRELNNFHITMFYVPFFIITGVIFR